VDDNTCGQQSLLILGTRTFAVEVADLAADVPSFSVVGFVENMDRARCDETLEGRPIFWLEDLPALARDCRAVCALSTTHRAGYIKRAAALGLRFATVVHPSARVSSTASIGEGSIVSAGVIVGARTRIGCHVIANRGALIGHHTVIGDFVTIGPGANLGGASTVGEAVYIGIGAIVLDHIAIGSRAIIGAGAVVNRDIGDGVQVTSGRARVTREGTDGW